MSRQGRDLVEDTSKEQERSRLYTECMRAKEESQKNESRVKKFFTIAIIVVGFGLLVYSLGTGTNKYMLPWINLGGLAGIIVACIISNALIGSYFGAQRNALEKQRALDVKRLEDRK